MGSSSWHENKVTTWKAWGQGQKPIMFFDYLTYLVGSNPGMGQRQEDAESGRTRDCSLLVPNNSMSHGVLFIYHVDGHTWDV